MNEKDEKVTTALARIDEVPEVLTLLDQEIGKLKAVTESVYKTTGNLEGFGDIKTETKIENLIRAFSSVKGREKAYDDAAKHLGLTTYPAFSISGGNAADWEKDIRLRIDVITHSDKLAKLNEYKDKMSKFLSAEDQKAMLLKDMTEYFKNKQ